MRHFTMRRLMHHRRPRRILLAAASMFALLATLLPATADAEQYVQNGIGWGNCVFSSWISDEGSLGGAESGTGTWDTDCNGVASKLHYFNFNDYFTTQWDIDWRNGNEFIVATWGNINNPLSGSTVPYYNQACAHTVANGWGCYNHFFGSPT